MASHSSPRPSPQPLPPLSANARRLAAIKDPAEVLAFIAKGRYKRAHGQPCPDCLIPTPEALCDWLRNPGLAVSARDAIGRFPAGLVAWLLDDSAMGAREWVTLCHSLWAQKPKLELPQGKHPLGPIIAAWQARITERLPDATVTVTGTGFTRRDRRVSQMLSASWDGASLPAVIVDGQPVATVSQDTATVFPAYKQSGRIYSLGEQRELGLPKGFRLPMDLRLYALSELDGCGPSLPADVLAIMTVAHAADRPMVLTEGEGASLLARHENGGFRRPRESDRKRFRCASGVLQAMQLFDPQGSGRWLNLALVDSHGNGDIAIGPPAWLRLDGKFERGFLLTADGGPAAAARLTPGKGSTFARQISGLEHSVATKFDGRPGLGELLRPENGKGSAGKPVTLTWTQFLRLGGRRVDLADPRATKAAMRQYERLADSMGERGYMLPVRRDGLPNLSANAKAGDAIEVLRRIKGGRGRPAGLVIRASARFVEAARLAKRAGGRGFRRAALADWLELPRAGQAPGGSADGD